VARAGEHLREQDRQDDVAGGLGVRPPPARRPQGDQEQRAHLAGHAGIVADADDGRSAG